MSCYLVPRRLISITGSDSQKFLQGLLTNDVSNISSSSLYGLFLTPKGRFLADSILIPQKDGYIIDAEESIQVNLLQHLKKHKLRAKVEIEDKSEVMKVMVVMEGTKEELNMVENQIKNENEAVGKFYQDPRTKNMGMRMILPRNANIALPNGIAWKDTTAFEYTRILNGVFQESDTVLGESVPLELNADFLNGISFTKGCYLGQELIARTHFQGLIRKRLFPTIIDSKKDLDLSSVLDTSVYFDNKAVGKMFSRVGNVALALLRIEHIEKQLYVTDQGGANYNLKPIFPNYFNKEFIEKLKSGQL